MGATMTRLFDPPRGAGVELGPNGAPARVDGMPAEAVNRWLVEVDWWRRPVAREYWKVLVAECLLCDVYHDLDQDAWFLERVYD
jgi:hypothetical protein